MPTASQPLQAHPDEFGLEDVDVLDDAGTMLLHVLWDSLGHEMRNYDVAAYWHANDGRIEFVGCTDAPAGLAEWVEGNHKVWERCRSEWRRHVEEIEP